MNVELIRKPRKPRWDEGENGTRPDRSTPPHGQERDATMAVMERNGEKAVAERGRAVDAAILSIEKQFGTGSIMKLGAAARQQVDFIPTGSIALDLALGRRRHPARPDHRDLRAGVVRQDDRLPARHRRGPAHGRRRRVHRRRARARSGLRPGLRRQRRRAARQPARHRRAGARDHRDARSARAASTSSSSTPWRPSCRAPRSRARWATRSSASRRGS